MVSLIAHAQEDAVSTAAEAMFMVNNTWMLVAVFPVFIMYLGFATVESELTRAKNNANILFKNTAFVSMGLLTYAIIGFKPDDPGSFSIGEYFGFSGFGLSSSEGAAGLIIYSGIHSGAGLNPPGATEYQGG